MEKRAVATAYWASGTVGWGADVRLSLDSDGHLYLHNSTGFNIMSLTVGIRIGRTMYFIKIDWDGIFRLYSHTLTQNNALLILWESSIDKCQPKAERFITSHGTVIYSMQEVKNNAFEDVPYSVRQKSKDDCEQACLEDSIYEDVLFNINGQCRMQRPPSFEICAKR
ncbi:hypothetical protein Patl1_27822 [Pistacia atlantica]|uniref:Uncharacterized protein n=1 Tax=Pistacia atlantica TaxID=434234 RepID=A0ACC1BFW0_9ROSI|nr:hypothetical protein Patl1_27822 [Pistacia atlantica]